MADPILCHKCGHDIDEHGYTGCFGVAAACRCGVSSSTIARHLLDAALTEWVAGLDRRRNRTQEDA